MIAPLHSSRRLLRPVSKRFIWGSLFLAWLLDLTPLGRLSIWIDCVPLVLCFWSVHQPQRVGMTTALLVGLVMDISQASVMGMNATAYILLTFMASLLSKRMHWYPLSVQAFIVLILMLGMQLVIACLLSLFAGIAWPPIEFFLPAVVSGFVWWPLSYVLLFPQFQPDEHDETRPI